MTLWQELPSPLSQLQPEARVLLVSEARDAGPALQAMQVLPLRSISICSCSALSWRGLQWCLA